MSKQLVLDSRLRGFGVESIYLSNERFNKNESWRRNR